MFYKNKINEVVRKVNQLDKESSSLREDLGIVNEPMCIGDNMVISFGSGKLQFGGTSQVGILEKKLKLLEEFLGVEYVEEKSKEGYYKKPKKSVAVNTTNKFLY